MIRNRRNIGSFWRGIDKNFSLKLEGERGVKPIQFFAGRQEGGEELRSDWLHLEKAKSKYCKFQTQDTGA